MQCSAVQSPHGLENETMGASREERKHLLSRSATPVHNLPTTRDVREKAWWARMKRCSLPRFPACHISGALRFILAVGPLKSKQSFLSESETDALPAGLPSPVWSLSPIVTCPRGRDKDARRALGT